MNKTKKIAFAAVAVVMAGSMAMSMTACTPEETAEPAHEVNYNEYLTYMSDTTLRMNVGNQNSTHPARIAFDTTELTAPVTLPDGNTYMAGDLKPAWAALEGVLDLHLQEAFTNLSGDNQITQNITDQTMDDYDIITASAAAMTQNTSYLINLTEHLDKMPNYKAFLDANPAIYYSLTSNTSNGAMYYAPYFDGLNDIEKYALAEKTWIETLLNANDTQLATATMTYARQAELKNSQSYAVDGTEVTATSYMGTEGSWEVDTAVADSNTLVKAKVDYDAAHDAAVNASSELGAAIVAAKGSAYTGESGNIVDIMNDVINSTEGEVTGGELTKILQEYIDVAYTLDGEAYENRADVFNSVSGAWDVDLLIATCRAAIASGNLLGADTDAKATLLYGISARQGTTQRRVDLTAFVGELYGIRGMESRYEYTYIDSNGEIQDARQNAESFDAAARFGELAKEGVLYAGNANIDAQRDFEDNNSGPSSLFMHDYSQTQTTAGFSNDDFNVSPIVTPVSKWDTDDDGTHETIMRFTESWRSTKNTGFCISAQGVANDENKLNAALAFIDYLFSNDGQILMTYGPMSTTGNTNPDGWWYATEASVSLSEVAEQVEGSEQYTIKPEYESQYFVYQNKVYEGMVDYSRAIPALTDINMDFFLGETVNGVSLGAGVLQNMSCANNYTNYARWVLGTTLPIGNKDQGFEYQCTADCALDGAAIVSDALAKGAIKHVKLSLDDSDSMWYMIAPTSLALENNQQSTLRGSQQTLISGTYFLNSSSTEQRVNVYLDLVYYGYDTTRHVCGSESLPLMLGSGQAYVDWLNSETVGLSTRVSIFKDCWQRTCDYFKLLG